MWNLIFKWLFPGIVEDGDLEPDDGDPEPEDGDLEPDDGDPEPEDGDLEPDDGDPEPTPALSRSQQAIITTRQRAQRAEDALRVANEELARARQAPANPQPQPISEDQRLWQVEEERLRDPSLDEWQKYSILSARNARLANSNSQAAVRRAEDLADQSKFDRLMAEKPKLYSQYKDRIETGLADLRARGMNAPRDKMLAILIGEDMINGKLKSAAPKAGAAPRKTVGVRSNVSAKGGNATDAEKRAKRLENIRI